MSSVRDHDSSDVKIEALGEEERDDEVAVSLLEPPQQNDPASDNAAIEYASNLYLQYFLHILGCERCAWAPYCSFVQWVATLTFVSHGLLQNQPTPSFYPIFEPFGMV
jgi:hypothetical protein